MTCERLLLSIDYSHTQKVSFYNKVRCIWIFTPKSATTIYLFSQFFMKYVLFYEKACNLVRWLKIFQLLLLEDIITPFSYSLCATGHYCPLVKYRLIIDSWPKDTRHTAQRPDATRTKQLISDHNSYTKWTFSYETPFKYEQSRTFLPKKTSIPSSQPSTGTGLWKWVKN